MNDKKCNTYNEMEAILKIADDSYKAHTRRRGYRGQMITAQDDYIFHVIQATKRLVSQNPSPCEPEAASPDQIELGKLASFGKSVWDWIKSNPDFCGDEFALTLMPMAEKAGLCKYETYDPEKHGDFPDLVAGEDDYYYWGGEL